ncbi:carbohydrate porin [Yersinia bercovieri]|uniref:carbohydrate porin n=1 Tax=Yersinia bercovieri TaxID=634 RepID=UPI0021BD0255|nr:carbohydrate porin [Yersinia bercovieri]
MTWETPQGNLKLYGDVEINMDAASKSGQLTSLRTSANKDWKAGSREQWDINGRILIGLDGYRRLNNGNFAGFTVQPLADVGGSMNLDDAAFFFGHEKDWKVKVGRFEAYDMFPLNQDTFVQHSGNTANDLYSDGYGYIYMMKEGRGRSNNGGNFLVSKYLGNWYFEVNTILKDGTSLFANSTYHGNTLENEKNVAYVRPVISWKQESLSAAIAMESNVISNAYGYRDDQGEWQDQSKRNGYGATFTFNNQDKDPENGIVANLSSAYMDATNEKNFSAGANILWRNFEIGYIYAHNDIEYFNSANAGVITSGILTSPDKYDVHTIHTSYKIANIMDMNNFNLYLGAYWSKLEVAENNKVVNGENDDRYGVRARFKYFF